MRVRKAAYLSATMLECVTSVVFAQAAPSRHAVQFGMDPQHSGRTDAHGPRTAPSIAWRFRARHRVFASPTVTSEGLMVFAGVDGMIHAVDRIGIERWAFSSPRAIFATPAAFGTSTLIAHDGGALVAVDGRGSTLWRVPTREDADAPPTLGPDGAIYLATRGVMALNPDGTVRWTANLTGHSFGAPALSRDGATLYVADLTGALSALRVSDGSVLRQTAVASAIYGAPLVLDDGGIVVGARDGHVRAYNPDGVLRWDFTTRDEIHGSPAQGRDGTVIVGSDDGGIYGLRPADGTQAFRAATSGRVRASARIDADGLVFIGSEDDVLYALDARGVALWNLTLGADIDSSVLITSWGALAVGCDDGGLYYLEPR